MQSALIIFSRFPELGTRKTWIIQLLGVLGVVRLHLEMTHHTLKTVTELAHDLGQKHAVNFGRGVNGEGAAGAVIIGTDCSELTARTLWHAFDSLKTWELVIGPPHNGGYYLIAYRRVLPQLFANLLWGTNQVFARTLLTAHLTGLIPYLLEIFPDMDRPVKREMHG